MTLTAGAVTAFLLFGHASLWIRTYNRVHARGISQTLIKICELVIYTLFATLLLLVCRRFFDWQLPDSVRYAAAGYEWLCAGCGLYTALCWLRRTFWSRPLTGFQEETLHVVDGKTLAQQPLAHGFKTRLLCALPKNQALEFGVQQRTLEIESLPAALDGLTIAHFSDLHYTGMINQAFFHAAVDQVNALEADLVAVTGDIVDYDHCISWIPETLGRFESRFGSLCILGNHDQRVSNPDEVRAGLVAAGLCDVGSGYSQLQIHGVRVLIAGNELPWFKNLPQPPAPEENAFRILLSHAPDQYPWAKQQQFDLMLAGHTHGQIPSPVTGPVVAPSSFGVRHSAGVFYEDATWLHVTRGLSGKQAIRLNCQPEIVKLVLRRPPSAETRTNTGR
mgnify:FL=1